MTQTTHNQMFTNYNPAIKPLSAEFMKDFVKLSQSVRGLPKSAKVSYSTRSGTVEHDYTPLDDILAKLKENDKFVLIQNINKDQNYTLGIHTILYHVSGDYLDGGFYPINFDGCRTKQDEGSAITYAKRYAISSFLGVASEPDVDGQSTDGQKIPNAQTKNGNVTSKATQRQLEIISNIYKDENLEKLLSVYDVKKLEELTVIQASGIIKKLHEKAKEQNNGK